MTTVTPLSFSEPSPTCLTHFQLAPFYIFFPRVYRTGLAFYNLIPYGVFTRGSQGAISASYFDTFSKNQWVTYGW